MHRSELSLTLVNGCSHVSFITIYRCIHQSVICSLSGATVHTFLQNKNQICRITFLLQMAIFTPEYRYVPAWCQGTGDNDL